MEVQGKVALVTGAGVRVGRAIALALAGRGMDVAVHYNSSQGPAEETAAAARDLGVRAELFQANLGEVGQIRGLARAIDAAWGRLDVLVNCAAIFPRTPWPEIDEATWDATLAVNLKAPFFVALHAAPLLKRDGGGKIVNIADWAGLRPYRHYLPYVVSKGGVMLPEEFDEAAARKIADATLVKRLGSPDDIAQSVIYLVEMTDFVTGHVLVVDGGRLIA